MNMAKKTFKKYPGLILLAIAAIIYGGTKPTPSKEGSVKLQPIKVDTNGMKLNFTVGDGTPVSNKTVRVYVRDADHDGLFIERFTFREFTGDEKYIKGFFMDRNQDVRVVISDD